MHYWFKVFLPIILIIAAFPDVNAQDTKVIRDFRMYTELAVEKKLFKNWEIGFETTLKLEKDASAIDEIDLDLQVQYSPLKFLSLATGYRYAFNHTSGRNYNSKYRLMGELNFDYDYRRFEFEYRIRYQNVDDDFFLYETTSLPDHILRNRLRIKYDIPKSKIEPYIFSEHYGQLGSVDPYGLKFKTGVGVRYSLKKYGQLKLYYRIDNELNHPYPYIHYILGVGYSYDF